MGVVMKKFVAAVLTVAIAGYWIPAASASNLQPPPAEIRGSVLAADGLTAMRGVSVKAANMQTSEIYTSRPTGENGAYRLTGLPAGSYDLAVETPQGLYAADMLIDAGAGSRTIVSLALKPGAPSVRQEDPPADPNAPPADPNAPPADPNAPGDKPADPNASTEPDDKKPEEKKADEKKPEEAKPEPQEQKKKKKGKSFWRSPGGAAIALVVGAALVGAAASGATSNDDDDDDQMSATTTSPN